MDALSQIVAVTGTLLGATVTYVFQQRSARRTEATQRAQRLREERLEAYGAYAGLLVEFRQAMLHHWFCVHEGVDAENETTIRGRSFELRSATQNALFRVLLVTDSAELVVHAEQAFAVIGKIDRAADRDDVVPRRDQTRDLIDRYVTTARKSLAVAVPAS